MADSTISGLTAATSLDGSDELVANDSGTTKKITVDNFSLAAISQNHAGEYCGGGGDISVADTNYVTIGSQSLTITAGDVIILEAEVILLNNSGATRIYTAGFYVGSFGVDVSDGAALAASATNKAPVLLRGSLEVRSSSVANATGWMLRGPPGAANTAGTFAALTNLRSAWNNSASDFTGTQTVKLAMKSAANTATQTMTILGWRIRKAT